MPNKKVNKKTIILAEAAKLFKEKGFGGTSMRDLAEKVGMEAASMYNHIKSKEEILELICFKVADNFALQLKEIETKEATFQNKLKEIIQRHIEVMINDPDAVAVSNNDWKYLSEQKKEDYKNRRKAYEKSVANILDEGMKKGEFKTMKVPVALFTILSALRWVEAWYKPGRGITVEQLEEEISTILLNGLNIK